MGNVKKAATIILTVIIILCSFSINGFTAAPKPKSLVFEKTSDATVRVGYSITRKAKTDPEQLEVAYSSSNPKVAKVNASGKVVGVAPGSAEITASCGGLKASYKVKVVPADSKNETGKKKKYTSGSASNDAMAKSIISLTNKERDKKNLAELEIDYDLMAAAQTRAEEIAARNSIFVKGDAHTRPDGSKWYTVLGVDKNLHYSENVIGGYHTAEEQINAWMNSSGHKANILNGKNTLIGVGSAVSPQGKIFSVQIFYHP